MKDIIVVNFITGSRTINSENPYICTMEILLTIKDESKAEKILAMLKKYSFIKARTLTSEKAEIIEGISKSVHELNLIRKGKLKGIPAEDLLNEL